MKQPHRHTFRWAAWLGWQLESNWTEPWLFIIYVLIKPLTSSLLLVCMYYAARSATQGTVPVAFLPYMYVSNACYGLVGAVMFGMSYAVISDREHYRMLKYIFIGPGRLQTYFVGRAVAGAAQALLGGLLNLAIGAAAFPEVRHALSNHSTDWGWLVCYLLIGTVLLLAARLNPIRHRAQHGPAGDVPERRDLRRALSAVRRRLPRGRAATRAAIR